MFTLPFESVTNWINNQDHWLPQSVDFVCPHCGRLVNFALAHWHFDNARSTFATASNCSGCSKRVRFWAVDPVKFGETTKQECDELCMHPTPRLRREPMSGLDKVPSPVARAYVSAVKVLSTGEWNASAVLVGRALEGLVKGLLPEDKQNLTLSRMLAELPNHLDLSATLRTLTDALRKGRNIGAHFDLEREADEEMAKMMLDFLEYFLEYLYILPGQVEDLHNRL